MKTIILFDTSVGSGNLGDKIIMNGIRSGLEKILYSNYVISYPTHTPCFSFIEAYLSRSAKIVENADLKFVCGTNLLANKMSLFHNSWNINVMNCKPLKNSVLVGCGNSRTLKKSNAYTRYLYSKVLSNEYIHSVRDEETRQMLEGLGYKAIVTGCPTLWGLTNNFINEIPSKKANSVVMSVTGYEEAKDLVLDQKMIDICKKNYENCYWWLQDIADFEYISRLKNTEGIRLLSPNLAIFSEFLRTSNVDYIGSRLHGGIFAMLHKKRTIIISIDNRAKNMHKINKFFILERANIDDLENAILSDMKTRIHLDFAKIDEWCNQFF